MTGLGTVKRLVAGAIVVVGLVPAGASADWPTYHLDNARTGNDTSTSTASTFAEIWSLPVDGSVYAEPLVVGKTVLVATEKNNVYALAAGSGKVLWSRALGAPITGGLPCGNILPNGITGTPVADSTNGILYVVAFLAQPSMHYELFALNLKNNGATLWHETLTAPNFDPAVEGQRGALTLSGGRVYVPFGGRWGDCGAYFGAVIGASASAPGALINYELTSGAGIWASSGGAVDASGNLYFATGNSGCTDPTCRDYSESVIKLNPTLGGADFFTDPGWINLNINDTDIGSIGPALIGSTLAFQTGKAGDGYLLAQSSLGGTGAPLFSAHVCPNQTSDAAFGGTAYAAPYLYVPCSAGLVALNVNTASNPPSFSVAWQGPGMSFSGPPIVSGGVVWTIDPNGTLYGLDPANGTIKFGTNIGGAEHFATPAAAGNRLFVGAGSLVVAYGFNAQPGATLSASSLAFGTQNLGATTAPQTITVTSSGLLPLTINGARASGDWQTTNHCPTTLASDETCTIDVTFTPRSTGPQTGTMQLFDNAGNSPQSVTLTGTGGPFFNMASGPAVTNWGGSRLDVFARGTDNALWHKYYSAAGWSDWSSLGGTLASDPAAVAWSNTRIDVFAQAPDKTLSHIYYDEATGGWSRWWTHAGSINSAPAVSTWGPGRLDVFARGATNNDLQHIYYSAATSWSGWYSHPGPTAWASRPAAVAWGPGRIDVFERGLDNALWHIYYSGGWSPWYSHGGTLNSGPAAASWGPGRLDVFMTGTDTALWHIYYAGGWSGWFSHGGALNADPAATAPWQGRLDIFGRGTDNGLRHIFYSSGWSGWYPY